MRGVGLPRRRINLRLPLVAALLYGGLWPLMNVAYIWHWYPLSFLTGATFWRRYSGTVGGPVHYLASLFSQTYARHWAGVLAFTLLSLAAWAIARGILRRFSSGPCDWPAAAFPVLILIPASRSMGVLFILPMVAGLAAAWLYMALCDRPRNGWAQPVVVALCLVASIPLYWLLASGFLYLCATCALFELLVRRRPAWCLAWIACGAAVPYAMSYVLFEPDIAGWYLRWMMLPQRDAVTTGLVASMYLFVPVGAVVAYLAGRFNARDRLGPRLRRAAQIVGFAALIVLASRLVALRFDTSGWIYADYLREDGRPAEALASLAHSADDSDPVRFLTLFALARAGRLPWEMFHYPQRASSDALLLRNTRFDTNPLVADWRSDLYLELGRVNDSQRWAHEGLSMEGETPRVLERLALTYTLNGNPDTARTFLRAFEKVPFQAARAREYLAALSRDPGMGSDPLVARVRPLMLRRDYVGDWTTEEILQQCLDANPSNRTAFEYLLAHYLLTSDMKGLASLAPRLRDFYRELPTHVQEALLGFSNVNGSLPPGIDASAIDSQTTYRFQRFIGIWTQRQNGPPEEAWTALAPDFGATWWFFYIFNRTSAGPPPETSADASRGTAGPQ
jgi:hypothetical protein